MPPRAGADAALVATYRLQLTPTFTFDHVRTVLPYLHDLGISHLYASPIARPRRGSTHGYDVCDPRQVNPELGTADELVSLLQQVRARGMGWIQDIVPNHMAYSTQNPLLVDVLGHGRASRYHGFFDIDWEHPSPQLRGRVSAPILGKTLEEALRDGELALDLDEGGLAVRYFEHRFPVRPESYAQVLLPPEVAPRRTARSGGLARLSAILRVLGSLPGPGSAAARHAAAQAQLAALRQLVTSEPAVRDRVTVALRRYQAVPGAGPEAALLRRLLDEQHYQLCHWRSASAQINYRRFFTINDLIAVRAEEEDVFAETHALVLELVGQGLVHGLRVDHVDGLHDPAAYLTRLRQRCGGLPIWVESILDREESLPSTWPVQGDTGYQFLDFVNGIQCVPHHAAACTGAYERFVGRRADAADLRTDCKRLVVEREMAGDVANLAHRVRLAAGGDPVAGPTSVTALCEAITEVLAQLPLYRTYATAGSCDAATRRTWQATLQRARQRRGDLRGELERLGRLLVPGTGSEGGHPVLLRLQQYTGAAMAKGFEDTFLYVYNRLVSLNEVGGWPADFGNDREALHAYLSERQGLWPQALSAGATHDTKRGEDTRARINVLSEIPAEWEAHAQRWRALNAPHRQPGAGEGAPSRNDEYLLYQTLVGTWPVPGGVDASYVRRLCDYLLKAAREAKVHASWHQPNPAYEEGILAFTRSILGKGNRAFLEDVGRFARAVAWHGVLNGLTQVVLRATAPGVPDIYQGTEGWDLSLVDPDNRRPVDWNLCRRRLAAVRSCAHRPRAGCLQGMLDEPWDGRVKLYVILRLLRLRRQHHGLFAAGQYTPLTAVGGQAECLVAFSRTLGDRCAAVVVPRWTAGLVQSGRLPLGDAVWGDTAVALPPGTGRGWCHALAGHRVAAGAPTPVARILERFPAAVLVPA
ncbi:MAG: malto-oligosyltrehalose synthase [Candidatus Latescibacterota bacterium]